MISSLSFEIYPNNNTMPTQNEDTKYEAFDSRPFTLAKTEIEDWNEINQFRDLILETYKGYKALKKRQQTFIKDLRKKTTEYKPFFPPSYKEEVDRFQDKIEMVAKKSGLMTDLADKRKDPGEKHNILALVSLGQRLAQYSETLIKESHEIKETISQISQKESIALEKEIREIEPSLTSAFVKFNTQYNPNQFQKEPVRFEAFTNIYYPLESEEKDNYQFFIGYYDVLDKNADVPLKFSGTDLFGSSYTMSKKLDNEFILLDKRFFGENAAFPGVMSYPILLPSEGLQISCAPRVGSIQDGVRIKQDKNTQQFYAVIENDEAFRNHPVVKLSCIQPSEQMGHHYIDGKLKEKYGFSKEEILVLKKYGLDKDSIIQKAIEKEIHNRVNNEKYQYKERVSRCLSNEIPAMGSWAKGNLDLWRMEACSEFCHRDDRDNRDCSRVSVENYYKSTSQSVKYDIEHGYMYKELVAMVNFLISTKFKYAAQRSGKNDLIKTLKSGKFQCDMAAYLMTAILRDFFNISSRIRVTAASTAPSHFTLDSFGELVPSQQYGVFPDLKMARHAQVEALVPTYRGSNTYDRMLFDPTPKTHE